MSLIEQLGGYENAKEYVAWAGLIKWNSLNQRKVDAVRSALLEHRRDHKVYEIGDFVLPISEYSDEVCEIIEEYAGVDFKYKTKLGRHGWIVKSFMPLGWRHATDEEIKAGHRL